MYNIYILRIILYFCAFIVSLDSPPDRTLTEYQTQNVPYNIISWAIVTKFDSVNNILNHHVVIHKIGIIREAIKIL